MRPNPFGFDRHLRRLHVPLTRAGVETLVVRQNEIEIERVDKADAAAIRQSEVSPTPQLTDLPPTDRDTWLVLEAVTFKRGNKSRFSEGGPPFSARITDQDFLDRIDSGEPFRKNDRFRVVLRQQQRLTDSGIKSRYDIVAWYWNTSRLDSSKGLISPIRWFRTQATETPTRECRQSARTGCGRSPCTEPH